MAWLIQVGSRRLIDRLRADQARRAREDEVSSWVLPEDRVHRRVDTDSPAGGDDRLTLLTLCCHPALTPASQIALTLRAVGGLATVEIARSLVTTPDAVARRITRAKRSIRNNGAAFRMPDSDERVERLDSVLAMIYLIFTEGYAATSGPNLERPDLAAEAIRLGEMLHALLADDSEVTGLLALMLLTDARAPARTDEHGDLIAMRDQNRELWKQDSIRRGLNLITAALPDGPVGAYQLQAAIAAVHDEAPTADDTDWPQIVALYRLLTAVSPGPIVKLNHAAAVAMVDGSAAGLELLDDLDADRLNNDHRLVTARAHMLEMASDRHDRFPATNDDAARTSRCCPTTSI